jgi:hypothetical protein
MRNPPSRKKLKLSLPPETVTDVSRDLKLLEERVEQLDTRLKQAEAAIEALTESSEGREKNDL